MLILFSTWVLLKTSAETEWEQIRPMEKELTKGGLSQARATTQIKLFSLDSIGRCWNNPAVHGGWEAFQICYILPQRAGPSWGCPFSRVVLGFFLPLQRFETCHGLDTIRDSFFRRDLLRIPTFSCLLFPWAMQSAWMKGALGWRSLGRQAGGLQVPGLAQTIKSFFEGVLTQFG